MDQKDLIEFYGHVDGRRPDPDRGLTSVVHADGRKIHMYKDQPGLYLGPMGNVMGREAAREAGMRVDDHLKQADRLMRTRRALAEVEETVAAIDRGENPLYKPADVEVTERNSKNVPRGTAHFKLDHVGGANFNVVDRVSGDVAVEKVAGDAAVEAMFNAQRERDAAILSETAGVG